MSQIINKVKCFLTKGCRVKDPNQKDVRATGHAADQLRGFDKPVAQWKKNPNRSYNDNPSRGNVGDNKI